MILYLKSLKFVTITSYTLANMKFCSFDNESDVRTRANIRHFVEYFESLLLFSFVKKSKQSEQFENSQTGT